MQDYLSHVSLAPHPLLADVCMHFLVKDIPDCWYTVPASPLPMLIVVTHGAVEMEDGQALPPLAIVGPSRHRYRGKAQAGSRFISAAFRPGMLSAILGYPVDEFSDAVIDLADVLPASSYHELEDKLHAASDTAAKLEALQDMLLRLRLQEKPRIAPLAMPPHWISKPGDELADKLGLGTRQFERRFLTSFGLSLRSYKQHLRYGASLMQVMLGNLPAPTWAECAISFGYADQAHMNRDFARFTGHTPAQLMRGLAAKDPALWAFRFNETDIGKMFIPLDEIDVVSVQDQLIA
ncbi:helix-turn-helix domain-containing protein [Undibacterium sp. Tian12W]|uniref:helix-turn-helix domain-containing protein n=1 Tax=Undibacterium sp. Tian12W TaxID=3413054 RepID=UPI003BF0DC92